MGTAPLHAGGKAGTAMTAQVGILDDLQALGRRQFADGRNSNPDSRRWPRRQQKPVGDLSGRTLRVSGRSRLIRCHLPVVEQLPHGFAHRRSRAGLSHHQHRRLVAGARGQVTGNSV